MRAYRNVILAALFPAFVYPQTKPFEQPFTLVPPGISIRMENFQGLEPAGLQQIRGFAADPRGFLWVWTNEGIARFDGYDVKVYREDLADTMGKFRTSMRALAVDGEGAVWAATPFGGVKRLDPSSGASQWFIGKPEDSTSIGKGATTLLTSSDGELWAGAEFGLAKYNRTTHAFTRYGLPPGYRAKARVPISSISELGRSIWVGLIDGGVGEFDRDAGSWRLLMDDPTRSSGIFSDSVSAVCGDRKGNLWIGTRRGLHRYSPATGSWTHYSSRVKADPTIPPRPVLAIAADDLGEVWISVEMLGIYRFDPSTGAFTLYHHDRTDPNSLPGNIIYSLMPQRSMQPAAISSVASEPGFSILWIPLGGEGAQRIIARRNPCTVALIPKDESAIPPTICALWYDTPDLVWGGVYNGGLGLFNLQTRKVRWYPGLDRIWRLGRLRDGSLLVVTGKFRAWLLEKEREAFTPVTPDLDVTAFLEDPDGTLWLGCSSAKIGMSFLIALDRKTGTRVEYPRQDPDSASHRDDIVVRMCDDGKGSIWYGTFGGGLIRFDRASKTYRRFAGRPGSTDGLVANYVSAIIPDTGNTLWVGTHGGLQLMDCAKGTFQQMHSAHPNGELYIRDMADDGQGHLWIAANQNPVCFTKASRTFRILSTPNQAATAGLWGVNFDPRSRKVSFGGASGFFSFPVDDPPPAAGPPPVVFTSFKVFEKDYPLDGEVWSQRSIRLPHAASFFSFTFAALDLLHAAGNQYAYKMEGVDPDWVHAGSRHYVSYTNLDPGRYVLRVKAANSEGTWNEEGASIEIIVEPPWYRTAWAYGGYVILGGWLLFLLYRFDRKRTALQQNLKMKSFEAEKMYEVDRMKSRFFANISHEFRTPLTLILGPLDQMLTRFKDEDTREALKTMRRNGLRLLQLINQLLDLSKMDAGKMPIQVRPLDLVALARPLVMSFMSLAERKQIQLVFDPEEDEIMAYVDRDKIEKILTNLLSNAFKFTGDGGEIRAVLRMITGGGARRAEIVISDTGIGIEGADLDHIFDRFYQAASASASGTGGTGIGLALTKELVDLHRGSIDVQSTPGRGSTFTVRLPIGKEHWNPDEIVTDEVVNDPPMTRVSDVHIEDDGGDEAIAMARTIGKPAVVLVEDNADVRTYIRGFLKESYAITEAANGMEALDRVRETDVDLVISDIMMPGMDGITLCKTLKSDDKTSHIPVVLLTARASGEGKLEGLDIGADDYITKPFDAQELIARVKNLIEGRRRLRERYERQVTLSPSQIQVTTADERFLKKFSEYVEQHIADAGYDTETLAHDLCMSRMQLNRKLHALTGHSTHDLVREFRLQRAADLLRQHADNVSGVAFEVGFNSLSHFARAFRERFGVPPSEYKGSVSGHPQDA